MLHDSVPLHLEPEPLARFEYFRTAQRKLLFLHIAQCVLVF